MNIVLEKNRVPRQASMTAESEKFVIPLPSTTSVAMALKILWQVSMALGWQTGSLSDFPPRAYVSKAGVYCAYVSDLPEEESSDPS